MTIDNRQHYIPVSRSKVKQKLFQLAGVSEHTRTGLEKVSQMLEVIWHHSSHSRLEQMKSLYESMDPDQIGIPDSEGKEEFMATLLQALKNGNWREISDVEMDAAKAGENVFPISLAVRFEEFESMLLYKLGQQTITDVRTSWFGLKKEEVIIDTFASVIQVIQYHPEEWFKQNNRIKHYPGREALGLHLRLFKTVPKLDLETIFPNASPEMRPLDKAKIIAPLVGGIFTLGLKFAPLLFGGDSSTTSVSIIGGICAMMATYILKSYMSYQKTREKYQSQVSKDLYFKGWANNAAVLNTIVDLAEEQEVKEALLAYTFLLVEPDKQYSPESLDSRIEEWLQETFSVAVGFEIEDALNKLRDMKLLRKHGDGSLSVESIEDSLKILDNYGDQIYCY